MLNSFIIKSQVKPWEPLVNSDNQHSDNFSPFNASSVADPKGRKEGLESKSGTVTPSESADSGTEGDRKDHK